MNITKYIFIICLLTPFCFMNAQVGIGTNNPAQKVLHIDTKQNNNEQGNPTTEQAEDDIIVDTTGNVGVGLIAPSYKLHIQRPDLSSEPFLRIEDGNQALDKVLTSDENGIATWKYAGEAEVIMGVLGNGYSNNNLGTTGNLWYYTGSSITLPPGEWVVLVTLVLESNRGGTDNNARLWIRTGLSDSSDNGAGRSNDIKPANEGGTNVISGVLFANSKNILNGMLYVTNRNSTPKTYYYKIENARTINGTGTWDISNFASKDNPNNSIMAFRVSR